MMQFTLQQKIKALQDAGYTVTEQQSADSKQVYYMVADESGAISYNFRNKPGTAQVDEMFTTMLQTSILNLLVNDNK